MKLLNISSIVEFCLTKSSANQKQTLKDVLFSTEQSEYVVIVGDSNSGKTSSLNIIASFDETNSDEVLQDGRNILSMRRR